MTWLPPDEQQARGQFECWYADEHGDSEGPWCREEMREAWLAACRWADTLREDS
jgi:hypothetical protein